MLASMSPHAIWHRVLGIAALTAATLVANPCAAATSPAPASEYRIRAGDQLSVTVYGDASLTQTVKVLPGGSIVMPLAGTVHVGGLTPQQAGTTLRKALGHYIKHPDVTVAVALAGPLEVLVLGDVKTPGKYELEPGSRLTDAVAAAGGLGITNGDYPTARLLSPGAKPAEYSLQRLLHDGDVSQNAVLGDDTTVYVPSPQTLAVQVLGAVEHPGDIELHAGDRLSMAIARAGASPSLSSDLNHIEIRRVDAAGTPHTIAVNLYEVFKNGKVDADPVMEKSDLVYVPQGRNQHDTVSPIASFLFGIRQLIGIP
jgi:protein involved in polysaccharide export with SLBB domain